MAGFTTSHYRGTSLIRKNAPPYDPTVGLCLGPYGGPRGVAVSYKRGTPVGWPDSPRPTGSRHLPQAKCSGNVGTRGFARVGHLWRDKWTALSGTLSKGPNHLPWSRRGRLLSSKLGMSALAVSVRIPGRMPGARATPLGRSRYQTSEFPTELPTRGFGTRDWREFRRPAHLLYAMVLQGYLTHKKPPPLLGPP